MPEKKKRTTLIKFETKLYRAAIRKAEKESFRQLLGQGADDAEALSPEPVGDDQGNVEAARLVEKGARDASKTDAHHR